MSSLPRLVFNSPVALAVVSSNDGGGEGVETGVMHITIAGAGSIGCFCGGLLAAGGHDVTLLGRPRILDRVAQHGLTVTDFSGLKLTVPSRRLTLSTDPSCMALADAVIVTVKGGATEEMAALIGQYALAITPILSFQNGIANARMLRARLPKRDVRASMVPFNVVPTGPATWRRATSGDIMIKAGPGDLAWKLSVPYLPIEETARIEAVQWGKLVINLNNALNALSGLSLREQLLDQDWRRLMADQMAEALAVLKAARIEVASHMPVPAWMAPHILRLPTPLFTRVAARMLTIDPSARASMAYDLRAGRPTEIDSLQGEIIRLGEAHSVPTPICERVATLIRDASGSGNRSPSLSPSWIAAVG